ncbi:dihydrodipicolinate synthetase [Defluviimonas sp. 20V17]|uniref:4-hydroxy-tetrahydrodipicolinate synthase n=1 Tax=Allgaiera indica TaxID=765699 RepID=A0AAN4URU0_9RHOB|nr:dihydrodipicolinate synthase family protein [Allgaiera indica]KDB02904.1 dihydrodipicolinate synthetase [Defluviimonas sp. 20V17]GHE01516.1 dihydrodipicolinate synthase family protein [Allgaiera indica]SDW88107.1 4-hydroxy-tetrahydrodipicolinate synthase [Allgaiera indica]
MLSEAAHGVFTIACTPFLPDGALDHASVASMTEFYLQRGATGLTLLGVMGEAPKLTQAESLEVVRGVAEVVAGAVPIVVGVSAPGFAAMAELAAGAMQAGAAGVMVAPPSSLRTDSQILDYYGNVARMLGDTPFVLQDFPLVTGVQIAPDVLLKIFAAHPTCVMLKHEDWPGLDKISALRRASDRGARRVSILCGNGGQFLPEELARGADGAMTGFAFPEMMAGVVAAHQAGDRARAQDIFDAYLPLVRYEAQPGRGLAIRKHILALRGAIKHADLRAPGAGLNPDAIAEVAFLIDRQERRLAELGL